MEKMNGLDSTIEALCRDATEIMIGKTAHKRQKWRRTGESVTLDDVFDYEAVLVFSINDKTFKETNSYRAMIQYLTNHPAYSSATNKVGYWGQPQVLIQRILSESLSLINGEVVISPEIAKSVLIHLKDFLNSSEITYEAKARLLGVKLTTPTVPISNDILLVKLTDEEMNKMQPYTDEYQWLGAKSNLLDHDTEVRFTLKIPVDSDKQVPLLSTQNSASTESDVVFKDIISTLRLYKPGLIELGPRGASSFFLNTGFTSNIYALPVILSEMEIGISDIEPLQNSYRIIRGCRSNDSVLDRALHRFLLARQKHDFSDRLVDFVIAWESLLLTVNKNAIRDELSYRFGINGSSILFESGAERNRFAGRKLMNTVYAVRSLIVHGASNDEVEKELTKADFTSIDSLVGNIEEKLRHVISWISRLDVEDRPYIKSRGWEHLLWGTDDTTSKSRKPTDAN